MSLHRRMIFALTSVVGALLTLAPAATAADVTLYELTENVTLSRANRTAISELLGRAAIGTPICPASAPALAVPGTTCVVHVKGTDTVNRLTGRGTMSGNFAVYADADGILDGSEPTILRGLFSGTMDFSPAIQSGLPYGLVVGDLTYDSDGKGRNVTYPFSGVFRMPFNGSVNPTGTDGASLRQILCPLTPWPNPSLGGPDGAWLDTTSGSPNGKCIDVQPRELNLGGLVVRFDIWFQP